MNIYLKLKPKYRIALLIFLVLITGTVMCILIYKKNEEITKENTAKAEVKLTENGFNKFYQKQDNEFCVTESDKQKQEVISKDMLWTLELQGKINQKIQKVKCKDGSTGVKIN